MYCAGAGIVLLANASLTVLAGSPAGRSSAPTAAGGLWLLLWSWPCSALAGLGLCPALTDTALPEDTAAAGSFAIGGGSIGLGWDDSG